MFYKDNRTDGAIHQWFELSYANYLVIPRSVLQVMPVKWQDKFVELLNELDDTFDWRRNGCWVKFKDSKGRFVTDELNDYRHTNFTPEQVKAITDRHNAK